MKVWLAVAFGGAVGAVARYGVSRWLPTDPDGGLPWATLLVNVVGSLLLGLVVGLAASGRLGSSVWAAMLGPGLCGALTTFSTFAVETVALARAGHHGTAIAYLGLTLAICLAAAATALMLTAPR